MPSNLRGVPPPGNIMTPTNRLLVGIGALAITWYFGCIIYIGCTPPSPAPTPPAAAPAGQVMTLRQFMTSSITTLSGTLATFVGMVLGFQQTNHRVEVTGAAAPVQTQLSIFQIVVIELVM